MARHPPRRYAGQIYWAKPVPGFGDPTGRIAIVGLAPAAHGGNRTGRTFTGDRSGDVLFAALHAVGLANEPVSRGPGDGLKLRGALITAACRCAPPGNKPLPSELDNCHEYLQREIALLEASARLRGARGARFWRLPPSARARRSRATEAEAALRAWGALPVGQDRVFTTYHPSQQNTFTGKLTPAMLRAVLRAAVAEAKRLRA